MRGRRGEEIVPELVNLRVVKRQVRALRTHISGGHKEVPGQVPLYVDIPLLYVGGRMVVVIGDGEVLDDLSGILLRTQGAQGTAYRRHDLREEGRVNCVYRYGTVNGTCVRGGGVIYEVVVRI